MAKTKRKDLGLKARNQPRPQRWKVDQDYLAKLSPEEREWLSRFNDGFYGGNFKSLREAGPEAMAGWSESERRQAYRDNSDSKNCAYNLSQAGESLSYLEDRLDWDRPGEIDPEPVPNYLNTQEYKKALAVFRGTLQPSKHNRAPVPTLEHAKAKWSLKRLTQPEIDDEEDDFPQ